MHMPPLLAADLRPLRLTWPRTAPTASHPSQGLLDGLLLHAVFQPLADLRSGTVYGHEALIRGPVGGPLHMPDALFARAAIESRLTEFELRCLDVILAQWSAAKQPGTLFVNLSADALVRAAGNVLPRMLATAGMDPRRLVIELTEHDRATDPGMLVRTVRALSATGLRLALDDFGDGHSSLRRWAELKPQFVKLDKCFTRNVAGNMENFEMVRAVVAMSETFSTALVAEGIESADDLRTLRDLGVVFGQGYFLGRPAPTAAALLQEAALDVLKDRRAVAVPAMNRSARPSILRSLPLLKAPAVSPDTTNEEVATLFRAQPELHALAVVDQGRPIA
ncbi:MAG: EAL domain-containing protein, partial [Comamonadaceae bacterium]